MKSFTISVDDEKARALITGISQRAANPLEANKIIASKMREDVLDHFRSEKGQDGPWKSLKPKTIEWKSKHGYSRKLQNTGTLRGRNMPEAGNDYAKVWNDLSYAGVHQFGTDKVPQRSFLWLSKSMLGRITKLMANYIIRKGLTSPS